MRDEAEAAPLEVGSQLHRLADRLRRHHVAVPRNHARVLVLHLGTALRQLHHEHVDGLQDVQRLESGHHHGLAVVTGDELVRPAADHRGHMPRPDETVEPQIRRVQDGLDRRDDRHVIAEHREVLQPLRRGADHRHRGGRRGGLEPDRHEHDLLVRVLPGDLQRVQRRVHHPDIGALGVGVEEGAAAARYPHHVAERGHDHVRLRGQVDRVVHPPHRDHADRAAGAVHQGDRLGQVVLEAVLVDRVGVPAAHLHQLVLAARLAQRRDLRGQRVGLVGITEFVDEFHSVPLTQSPTSRRLQFRWCRPRPAS